MLRVCSGRCLIEQGLLGLETGDSPCNMSKQVEFKKYHLE
jgi:hypothetical protein